MEVFLRFIADTSDTVIREVRIKGSASLLQLHEQVYATFGLEPGEMGSFYYSTADWDQGEELPMFSIDDSSPSMETMTVDFVVLNAVGELDKKASKPSADVVPGMAKDPSQMTETEINAMYGLDDLEGSKDPYSDEEEDRLEDEEYY